MTHTLVGSSTFCILSAVLEYVLKLGTLLVNKSLFVYYTLIDPFLTYSLISWRNTYTTSLQPLTTLQKKAVRIITFSDSNPHSSPLFRKLGLLKLKDLIYLDSVIFMHYRLPSTFNNFFKALIKYINMQQDWPLRSLIIYRKLGRIMDYLISVSVGLLFNAIKEDLKSASRFRFKNIDWCTLYAANCVHSRCFVLLLCLFVCVFVYLLQLKYFFFVCFCVHLFIYNNFDI